jgi:hypothetical protein
MPRFDPKDFNALNNAQPIQNKMRSLIDSSLHAVTRVENFNQQTGDYRVVLEGTLEPQSSWSQGHSAYAQTGNQNRFGENG